MIDLHTHFLPAADGCVQTITESLTILKKAELIGIKAVVLTVCYIPHLQYVHTVSENQQTFQRLKKYCQTENIQTMLYLGNEILMDDKLVDETESGRYKTLGNSKTLLIETPEDISILEKLLFKGYRPLLANPERYAFVDDYYLKTVRSMGVQTQGSLLSVIGHYGENARLKFVKMLEKEQFDCLATGARDQTAYDQFDKLKNQVLKIIDLAAWDILTNENPKIILKGDC